MLTELRLRDNRIVVRTPFHPDTLAALKAVDHRARYEPLSKTWSYPSESSVLEKLVALFGLMVEYLDPELHALLPPASLPAPKQPIDWSIFADYSFITEPYTHQKNNLANLILNRAWLIADEQGAGKTKPICDRIRLGFQRGEFQRVFIVCPKSVLSVWPKELKTHAELDSYVPDGDAAERVRVIQEAARHAPSALVCNYDLLYGNAPDPESKRGRKKTLWKLITKLYAPQVIVADEAHKIKNPTSKSSRATRGLGDYCRHRWALSGTPAPNGPLDWQGVLLFLDRRVAGTESKVAFRSRYAITTQSPNGGAMVVGYKDLPDLNQRVRSISSRVLKADCLDLPPKVFTERTCSLSGEQARVYGELKKDAITKLNQLKADSQLTVNNVLSESLRLLQVVGGFVPSDLGDVHELLPNVKIILLEEVLEEIGDAPVIIWCAFRAEIARIGKLLKYDLGRETRILTGDTSKDDRAKAIDDFQSGRADTFLGMAAAGGMGINLTRATHQIYYSRNYNLADYLQSLERAHRPGQVNSLTSINLICEKTVDRRVDKKLKEKESLQELMMADVNVEELL